MLVSLHNLSRQRGNKKGKRIGRGGKRGTYSGRGVKGQLARSGRKLRPELRDIIRRLPKRRGRGKNANPSVWPKTIALNLAVFNDSVFDSSKTVTPEFLAARGILPNSSSRRRSLKILAKGKINKPLNFKGFQVSAAARAAIEKIGGQIIK